MTKYNHLQTTAFRVGDTTAWNGEFHLLRFPEPWKAPLIELTRRDNAYDSIPITRLNKVLATLVPDIITVATKAIRGTQAPWLYSDDPVPADRLFPILTAWVRTLQPDRVPLTEKTLAAMSADHLVWEPVQVDFADAAERVRHGDTDDVVTDTVFRLLPHRAAAALSADGMKCEHGGGTDDDDEVIRGVTIFRRSPAYAGPAEITSWPPHSNPAKPFSFIVTMTAQTRPFDGEALLYAQVGARRWAHRTPQLDTRVCSTVFFLPSVPWLPETAQSRSFLRAAIKLNVTRDARGERVFQAEWDDLTVKILANLGIIAHLGMPEEIRKNPKAYLDHATTPAGLVYRNGLYPAGRRPHPVLPGASVRDRRRIIDWIADSTGGALRLTEPLKRCATVAIPGLRMLSGKDTETEPAASRLRASIARATGTNRLAVEVFYDTSAVLDAALAALQSQLGVKFELPEQPHDTDAFTAAAASDELHVTLRVKPIGALAADLQTNPRYTSAIQRIQNAVQTRATEIAGTLPDPEPDAVTVSLIEIGGKDFYQGKRREKDPKFAIRHGFTLKGRITQFVTPQADTGDTDDAPTKSTGDAQTGSKSDPHLEKLRSCWRDVWRQLGARPEPIPLPVGDLPTRPRFLAFYVIRQNRTRVWGKTRQVPLAVLMDADGGNVRIKGPGMDMFTPVHTGALELGRINVMANQSRSPELVAGFFKNVLDELDPDGGLFLLTEAHNLRSAWTFLQNSEIVIDALKFGDKGDLLSVYDYPGLRHVRVRTDQRFETPEGYAVSADDAGHAASLWAFSGDRVFISTADKPFTAQKAVKDRSKVEPRQVKKQDGTVQEEPVRLGTPVWNHQLVELAVVAKQEGDLPESWAALAHNLRSATPHADKMTILPWPLHQAKLIGEYVLPVELLSEIEAEESEEPSLAAGARSFDSLTWEQPELDFGE